MKSIQIVSIAIILLIALISVHASATTDSYQATAPATTKPPVIVDKYQKPVRKICKPKCLTHKYIKKCKLHKYVGRKRVCHQYTTVGAGKCLKYYRYSKCHQYSKPAKRCASYLYKRAGCARSTTYKKCGAYGTKRVCKRKSYKKYCAKHGYIQKCFSRGWKKVCNSYIRVPVRKCKKNKVCKYKVDSYNRKVKKCKYVKQCRIVSWKNGKCKKYRKVRYCKQRKSVKKCYLIKRKPYCAKYNTVKYCKYKKTLTKCLKYNKKRYCARTYTIPARCLRRKQYKKCLTRSKGYKKCTKRGWTKGYKKCFKYSTKKVCLTWKKCNKRRRKI